MPRIPADLDKITDRPHRPAPCLAIGGLADEVDLIRQRAAILKPADRALVMLYLDCGRRFAELAAIAGVSETTIARAQPHHPPSQDGYHLPPPPRPPRPSASRRRDHLIDGMPSTPSPRLASSLPRPQNPQHNPPPPRSDRPQNTPWNERREKLTYTQ